tara:strand:+ start:358 stop:1122 length:765 start_codon:yes stop_codon:yes gene_type:complete
MTEDWEKSSDEILANLAIDPDVLAKELAAEQDLDPLEEIDKDDFSANNYEVENECKRALQLLKGNKEQRIQGLRIFCEYRDKRAFPLLLPLLREPCPVERMSAVYALGRNPCPEAVDTLLDLLKNDSNAYVRRATAWSLANYGDEVVVEPLINALKNDVAAVRLWASSSLAEAGASSPENAQRVSTQLLISLRIDNEPVVRSNCIWSLSRLYELLNEAIQKEFIQECQRIYKFEDEPTLIDECKLALEAVLGAN